MRKLPSQIRYLGLVVGAIAVAVVVGVALSVNDTVKVLDSLQGYVWPVVAIWLLWRLLPVIARVLESRRFEVEVAGVKLSVQEALDQIPRQIADLQEWVALTPPSEDDVIRIEHDDRPSARRPGLKRVLWVDDRPTANVFEMKTLEDEGWAIDRAASTAEALRLASGRWDRYTLVISDMGRLEEDRYVPQAGIALAEALKVDAPQLPLAIYTSSEGRKLEAAALDAGAQHITSSPIELLQFARKAAS